MPPEIAALTGVDIGLGAIGGAAVLAVLFGWLIPRWSHNQVIKERDKWQRIAQDAVTSLGELTRATDKQASAKDLSVSLLQSVRAEAAKQEDST